MVGLVLQAWLYLDTYDKSSSDLQVRDRNRRGIDNEVPDPSSHEESQAIFFINFLQRSL